MSVLFPATSPEAEQYGEVLDRHWLDILGVIKIQAGRLDSAYLRRWAADLNVSDLLKNATGEAAQ